MKYYPDFSFTEFNQGIKERLIDSLASPLFIIIKKKLNALRRDTEKASEYVSYLSFLHPFKIYPRLYNQIIKLLGFSSISLLLKSVLISNDLISLNTDGSISMNGAISELVLSDVIFKEKYIKTLTTIFHGVVSYSYSFEGSRKFISAFNEWSFQFEHFFSKNWDYTRAEYMEALLYYFHLKKRHHGSLSSLWITPFQLGEKLSLYLNNYDISRAHILLLFIKLNEVADINKFSMCYLFQKDQFAGVKHFDLADSLIYLAKAEATHDMGKEALEHLQEALNILLNIYPSGHPSIAECYEEFVEIHKRNRVEEAVRYHQLALNIKNNLLFNYDPSIGESYFKIAEVFYDRENWNDAISRYVKALDLWEQYYGTKHICLAQCLVRIADCHFQLREVNDCLLYTSDAADE